MLFFLFSSIFNTKFCVAKSKWIKTKGLTISMTIWMLNVHALNAFILIIYIKVIVKNKQNSKTIFELNLKPNF